jgi:hypothetical protein
MRERAGAVGVQRHKPASAVADREDLEPTIDNEGADSLGGFL